MAQLKIPQGWSPRHAVPAEPAGEVGQGPPMARLAGVDLGVTVALLNSTTELAAFTR